MDYGQLDQADLSGLKQAVADWRQVKSAYEGLGDQYDQHVKRRLTRNWEGEAAAAASSEIGEVRKQMNEASGEAGRMARLLDDIHHDLGFWQTKLHKLTDDMLSDHLAVDDHGTITDRHPLRDDEDARHDADYKDWTSRRQKLMQEYAEKVEAILKKAGEADAAAEASLRADPNGKDDRTFTRDGYTTLDEAAAAQRDGQLAAHLMRANPTDAQLDELSQLLGKYANDPLFAEKFATTSGADGALKSYMGMMNPPPGTAHGQKSVLLRIQRNLGSTLGTASRIDSRSMAEFRKDLVAAGKNDYQAAGGAPGSHSFSGYQLTSSLLSHGQWEKNFLTDYGTRLVKEENERWAFFGGGRESDWGGHGSDLGLIDSDPMVGFSDGLGHNPEASTSFLSASTDTDDGKVNNLDYLLKEREWHGGEGDKAHLGHALESATTGHAYDVNPTNPAPPHSEEQAALMEKVVRTVAEDPDLAGAGMKDSLGRMAGEYMPDLNRSFYLNEDLAAKVMPSYGASADMLQGESSRFLYAVSSDPEGYAAVTLGERQYSASLIAHHAQTPDAYQIPPDQKMQEITHSTGYIDGIAANAKSDEILRQGLENDQQFNEALQRGGKWGEALVSVGGAAAGAAGGGPVGAAVGSTAAAEAGKIAIGEVLDGAKQDLTSQKSVEAADIYARSEERTHDDIWKAVSTLDSGPPPGITEDQWMSAIERGVSSGYDSAQSDVDKYATNRPEDAESPG